MSLLRSWRSFGGHALLIRVSSRFRPLAEDRDPYVPIKAESSDGLRSSLHRPCVWVPAFRFAAAGMTPKLHGLAADSARAPYTAQGLFRGEAE